MDGRTRTIYDVVSRPESARTCLLTTENLLGVADAVGTEAEAATVAAGGRILATVWARQGKYSVEYYRSQDGGLLFVYESTTSKLLGTPSHGVSSPRLLVRGAVSFGSKPIARPRHSACPPGGNEGEVEMRFMCRNRFPLWPLDRPGCTLGRPPWN